MATTDDDATPAPRPARRPTPRTASAKTTTASSDADDAASSTPKARSKSPARKPAAPRTAKPRAKATPARARAAKSAALVVAKPAPPPILEASSLVKRFGDITAVNDVTFSLQPGTFTGIVGPNGAGKTTTLSMITGLLRPTQGQVSIAGFDVWSDPAAAKRRVGVLPDRLHLFDRLTGAQLLYYTGVLHGLDRPTATERARELAAAFRVEHAMGRLVTDYSSGMVKKVALAAALIHSPRLLVLDEPFESVDPVSAMTVAQILRDFAAAGGTVLLSSHSMELVQRICDHVIVVVDGRLIADGTVDDVRGDRSLQERFVDLAGPGAESIAELTWLHRFSD
jgi:ABC-2 type transport system ATP-binding protein